MHLEVEQFVEEIKEKFPEKFVDQAVLDCGSYDINGSLRKYFTGGYYHGIDIHDGPGVDEVILIHSYLYDEAKFDTKFNVIVCSEALEHDKYWEKSWASMCKSLAPGGLLIMTCAGPERQEHGTHKHGPNLSPATNDYYENRELDDFPIPPDTWSVSRYVRGEKDVNIAFKLR